MASTLHLRQKLVVIAESQLGVVEIPKNSNTGPDIIKYQRATTLDGTGWPYCAAFVCWCIREWLKDPEVYEAIAVLYKIKNPKQMEQWRPKTAAAFGLKDWAEMRGVKIFNDSSRNILHTADIVTFDFSHTGILYNDHKTKIYSIDGNTSPDSRNNEGGGVYRKERERSVARNFLRILP